MMRSRAFVALGNFFFHVRNGLFPLLVPLAFLPGPPLLQAPLRAVLAGFVIAATGQAIRVATIGLKYIIRGGRNRRIYAEDLVTDGIYAHSRNPMYVGQALLLAAWAVWLAHALAPLGAVAFVLYITRFQILPEERALAARFGDDWRAYRARVRRWL